MLHLSEAQILQLRLLRARLGLVMLLQAAVVAAVLVSSSWVAAAMAGEYYEKYGCDYYYEIASTEQLL